MADARRYFTLPSPFKMHRGGELHEARIAFETWGELNPERDNAVLIMTGLSPDAHAASSALNPDTGWWEGMLGPGKAIDSERHFVICVNPLGSCKGSTGPASPNPETGKPYRLDFPELSIEDVARAAHALVQDQRIECLHTLVGPSMGGMSALAYAAQFPAQARNLVLISTAPHALPFSIALRSLQREAIRLDPNWNGGNYDKEHLPMNGMRLARKLGMISYRSAREWRERFQRKRMGGSAPEEAFGPEFEIESYLEGHAQRFIGAFDPNCYIYLSRAMDWFDLTDHGGSVSEAIKRMQTSRALVLGVETDILFPPDQQEQIADALRAAGAEVEHQTLPSLQGHDSFLVDIERFGAVVGEFMHAL